MHSTLISPDRIKLISWKSRLPLKATVWYLGKSGRHDKVDHLKFGRDANAFNRLTDGQVELKMSAKIELVTVSPGMAIAPTAQTPGWLRLLAPPANIGCECALKQRVNC